MPLASLFALQWYGPHCAAAVGSAAPSTSPAAVAQVALKGDALNTAVASSPSSSLTNGRRGEALGIATSSGPRAAAAANLRGGALGVVNALTQGDVTGALFNLEIEDGLTLPQVLRLLLSVSAGNASGLDGNPVFKAVDGVKTRVAGTRTGGTRTITTRDPT